MFDLLHLNDCLYVVIKNRVLQPVIYNCAL